MKTYLGDGVYAEFDGFNIQLYLNNGYEDFNHIILEPETFKSLMDFHEKIQVQIQEEKEFVRRLIIISYVIL